MFKFSQGLLDMVTDGEYFTQQDIHFPSDLLYIDRTNSRIGISTNAPGYSLDVVGNVNFSGSIFQNGSLFTSSSSDWTSSGTNTYTTTSNIGIGTATPTSKLMIYDTSATDTMILKSTNSSGYASISFQNNTGYAYSIGVGGSTGGYANKLFFHVAAAPTYSTVITPSGYVGIGITSPTYPLYVNSHNGQHPSGLHYYWVTGANYFQSTSSFWGYGSIYASNWIQSASGFRVPSDIRIKKDIIELDDVESLQKINNLEVKRYKYIDTFNRTDSEVYGFIAQQVQQVVPYAVVKTQDYVPTIYKLVSIDSVSLEQTDITGSEHSIYITLDHKLDILGHHGELTDPIQIRVYDYQDKSYEVFAEIVDSTHLRLRTREYDSMVLNDNKIFIFGPFIKDFLTLDKERIFTLSISAIQEIDRKYTHQIKELTDRIDAINIDLLNKVDALQAQITALTSASTTSSS